MTAATCSACSGGRYCDPCDCPCHAPLTSAAPDELDELIAEATKDPVVAAAFVEAERKRMFANPYNACTTCGVRVTDYVDNANVPCGHGGYDRTVPLGSGNAVPVKGSKPPVWTEHVEPWKSVCPSWGPVDGCICDPPCVLPPEGAA